METEAVPEIIQALTSSAVSAEALPTSTTVSSTEAGEPVPTQLFTTSLEPPTIPEATQTVTGIGRIRCRS